MSCIVSYAQAWLACVHLYRGRWDDVAPLARLAVASGNRISEITGHIALGRLRARRGDPGALDVLDEALELARPGGHLQRLGHVHAARAEAAWLAGDGERAAAEARAAYPLALEKRHLWFAGELAYWQWRAGELEEAPDWIAEPYRLQLGRLRARGRRGVAGAWVSVRGGSCARRVGRATRTCTRRWPTSTASAPARRRPTLRRRLGLRGPRADDARRPGRPDRARAGGARARRGWLAEPRDRGTSRALLADGRPSRLFGAAQAGGADALRGRRALPRKIGSRRSQHGRFRRCRRPPPGRRFDAIPTERRSHWTPT